jgi:hypothetical protein
LSPILNTHPVLDMLIFCLQGITLGRRAMLRLVETPRVYPPETLTVMAAAFDQAWQSLPRAVNGNDDLRRQLALIILQHVDRGEHDPIRLSEIAYRELAGLDNLGDR